MIPECRMVKLDWDRGTVPPDVGTLTWLLGRAGFRPVALMQKRSPGGRGWHGWLIVRPVPSFVEIVALQAILGSDPSREACNLARAVLAPTLHARQRRRWNVTYAASRTMGRLKG